MFPSTHPLPFSLMCITYWDQSKSNQRQLVKNQLYSSQNEASLNVLMWKDIHEIWLFFKIHVVEKYDPICGFFFNQKIYAYIWTEHFFHI